MKPHELAGAQGFPVGYKFSGTKTDSIKQIGNAVPRNLARAIVLAALNQSSDISKFLP
jgi:DNA (cytosine-5)-methyltransferase 1